jgi:hypothetical protein
MKKHISFVMTFGVFWFAAAPVMAGPDPDIQARDLDGDGYKEARTLLKDGVIQRTWVDADLDGSPEMVIQYRNGRRDIATVDSNRDGTVDTWVHFYFTGAPWKVAEDYDGDGRADYWLYLRDGVVYKWEQDRNGDGKPDLKTVEGRQSFDDDFDGVFERPVGFRRNLPLVPGDLHRSLI